MFYDDDDEYLIEGDYPPPLPLESELELYYDRLSCHHKWKPTLLIFSTVFDCELCGMKKEDYDKLMDEEF